jgi:hypothetical protein
MQPSASNAVWRSIGCGWHVGGCVLLGCGNNTQTLLLLLLLAVAHISTRRLNFPHLFPGVGVSCDVYRQQQQHDKNKDKNEPRRRRNSFLDLSLLYSFLLNCRLDFKLKGKQGGKGGLHKSEQK